jgi:diadenosine tetraphosphate (Ap4A) HIT family hydrolase
MQQEVDHVHFHVIPKPNKTEGLGIGWPALKFEKEEMQKIFEEIKGRL